MRELSQLDEGMRRYYKKFEQQGAGESKAGLGLVYVAMKAMIPWIDERVAMLEDGKEHPSSVPLGIHWLMEMQSDAVAYITAKLCVSASYNKASVTRTAMRIANLIEENYRYEELEQAEPALANSMGQKAKRWSRASTRRKIMRKAADVAGVRRMGWTEQEKLKLGVKLIEAYVETTGFAELVLQQMSERRGPNTQKIMHMTDEAVERLNQNHGRIEFDDPENRPMLHPPKPWTTPLSGGYLTERMKRPILRGATFRKVTEGLLDELFSTDLTEIYDAVNAVQATPWRINKSVLDVLTEAWKADLDMGVLPEAEDIDLPPLPAIVPADTKRDNMTDEEKQALDGWKKEARQVHEYNAMNRSKRFALLTKLTQAAEVADEEAIYFPHSLDFRGRIYPMSSELSPQSDDLSKSLLQFAEAKPLGTNGGYWLAVHIANLFGHDKIPFDERVQWTLDHTEALLDSASSPLDGEKFWTTADEPWCALAACFEWYGFQLTGPEYESSLPIAMDGSCSGIQHFSAMLRDQRGAEAVNLVCNERPADIYIEVLEEVRRVLKAHDEPLAKVWLDKVDRKIVKRPCMTFAYSVTSAGIKQQILDEIRKRQEGDYLPGTPDWQAAVFLAPIVEESIRTVVDRAAEAMDWLKGMSKVVSANEVPTGWTTPLGFKVLQPYLKSKGKRIKVLFQGQPLFLTLTFEGDKIDRAKQSSAVAPNFVHSLDATHLMMTVSRLKSSGITRSFAVIHDSFGVHACDVDELHYALRDEFVRLYKEHEVLVEFYRESLLRLPGEDWPKADSPPEAGDYDIEEVRDADFFFA
jgi:DNA-directed RNA polymerase